MKFLKNWFSGRVENVTEGAPEAWHTYSQSTKYVSKEVVDFYNQFDNREAFNIYEESLYKRSTAYHHYSFNEPTSLSPEIHGRIIIACSNDASLDECVTQFRLSFPNYTKKKQRQEILDSGKEDFITHLKLLKASDPELARQKVLEILQEVI